MVRQDRGFDPILWISSVADYLKKNDRDEFSVSFGERRICFSFYTRAADRKSCFSIGSQKEVLILVNTAWCCVFCSG